MFNAYICMIFTCFGGGASHLMGAHGARVVQVMIFKYLLCEVHMCCVNRCTNMTFILISNHIRPNSPGISGFCSKASGIQSVPAWNFHLSAEC